MTDDQIIAVHGKGLNKSVRFSDSTSLVVTFFTDPSHTVQGDPISISCYNDFRKEEVRFSIKRKAEKSFYVEAEARTYFLNDRVPDALVDDWLEKIRQAVRALKLSQIEVRSRPIEPLR